MAPPHDHGPPSPAAGGVTGLDGWTALDPGQPPPAAAWSAPPAGEGKKASDISEHAHTGVLDARELHAQLAAMRRSDTGQVATELLRQQPAAPVEPLNDPTLDPNFKPKAVKKAPKPPTGSARPTTNLGEDMLQAQLEASRRTTQQTPMDNEFTDVPTGVLAPGQLQATLERMIPDDPASQPPMPEAPPVGMFKSIWALPLSARALLVGLILALAVPLGILLTKGKHPPEVSYLRTGQPLRTGPSATQPYTDVRLLKAGAEVRRLADFGVYQLVQDALGHVGFVPSDELEGKLPPLGPEQPFADCQVAPLERSSQGCLARAERHHRGCLAVCDARADARDCAARCGERQRTCELGCNGKLETPVVVPKPVSQSAADALPASDDAALENGEVSVTTEEDALAAGGDGASKKGKKGKKRRKAPRKAPAEPSEAER